MNSRYVVHLTPTLGSMQASARIARFLADQLDAPLLDCDIAIQQQVKPGNKARDFTLFFVNGTIAFSGIRDQLGMYVLPRTKKVVWLQQDYSITPPPHHSWSRPTVAVTPFRMQFFGVPEIELWSTCEDWLAKRGGKYINWNALTYAPFKWIGKPPSTYLPRVFYYGALRKGREAAMHRLLNSPHVDIGMSRTTQETLNEWAGVARAATLLDKVTKGQAPSIAGNGNTWGMQPLLGSIARYQHSVYIADDASSSGLHSPANRFYEVLSTPNTVLWLDVDSARAYDHWKLQGWDDFVVSDAKDWDTVVRMTPGQCAKLASKQRMLWLQKDPYKQLLKEVRRVTT